MFGKANYEISLPSDLLIGDSEISYYTKGEYSPVKINLAVALITRNKGGLTDSQTIISILYTDTPNLLIFIVLLIYRIRNNTE